VITETYGDWGYARRGAEGARRLTLAKLRHLAEPIPGARTRIAKAQRRTSPHLEDTLFSVAMLSLVLFAEPLHEQHAQKRISASRPRDPRSVRSVAGRVDAAPPRRWDFMSDGRTTPDLPTIFLDRMGVHNGAPAPSM
jgi:hypothetical protein